MSSTAAPVDGDDTHNGEITSKGPGGKLMKFKSKEEAKQMMRLWKAEAASTRKEMSCLKEDLLRATEEFKARTEMLAKSLGSALQQMSPADSNALIVAVVAGAEEGASAAEEVLSSSSSSSH